MNKVHDTPFVRYVLHDHSIIEATYKKGIPLITKELAQRIVSERLALQGGKPYRLLLHGDIEAHISAEAKRFFSSPEGTAGIVAAAILVNRWSLLAVSKFIMAFQRSDFPMYIFRDTREAKNWLLKNSIQTEVWDTHPKSLSQQYVDYLFNRSPEMQMILSEHETIIRVNSTACQRLGYTEEQLIGRPLSDLTRGELKNIYDNMNQPIPVQIDLSSLPMGHGGRSETFLIARETCVSAGHSRAFANCY